MVQDNGDHSMMDLILKVIDDYKINTDGMSVIVTNIREVLMEKSKVYFLNDAPFDDFLKGPLILIMFGIVWMTKSSLEKWVDILKIVLLGRNGLRLQGY